MYAGTIKTALSTHPLTQQYFKGVKAADLPNRQHGIYVVNTQPKHQPGEHWVTVEYAPTFIYYFDPYGLPPHPNIWNQLKRTNRQISYASVRRQGHRKTCGLYCIYHTLTRCSDQHDMNVFNTNLDFNDRLVYQLVSHNFKLK